LFLFDEPTTGLHFDDIARLLRAFRQLIAAGHSLVVIEHNLDVIRSADWIIDLGPEGGDAGGELVCVGTPQDVAQHPAPTPALAARMRGAAAAGQVNRRAGEGRQMGISEALRRRSVHVSAFTTPASTTCVSTTSRFRAASSPS
jgi:excinuclease ABC subunit A